MKKKRIKPKNKPTKKLSKYQPDPTITKKLVLHVGCGDENDGFGLHKDFDRKIWHEVRLDICADVKPEIQADIRDMHMIDDCTFNAIWSSHNIEHIYDHDVIVALREFHRVLDYNGHVFLATPDIQSVAEGLLKKGIEGSLYESPSGVIAPIDVMYGLRSSLKQGHNFMAHKTAFTAKSLAKKFTDAGFLDITVQRNGYNLWAIAYKRKAKTSVNSKVKFVGDDINKMMLHRDRIDKEPNLAVNY